MARLLPFYRTGASLSGGGGGGVLGDATVWPAVLDWSSLGTIAGPLRVGDRVEVSDLQPGLAYAARYSGSDWELAQAVFPTVSDLLNFSQPIFTSATAIVGSGVETDPMYYYDGSNWQRMADTVPFAWTLTETQLLEGTDPSGIGAVQDGDYGTYTPAGGAPIVVRFKASCPAPGGNRPVWMIPEAYAGSPQVVAWLTGSEGGVLASTLAAQGWTVTTTGSGASQGTVTLNSGYVRCFTPAGTGGTAQVITPTWLGSQRFCVQGLMRGSAAGSDPYVGLLQVNNNDIQYTFMRGNLSGVFRHFTLSAAPAWTTVDSLNSLPNNGATPGYNLDASTPWFFQAIGRELTSATVSETVETRINGELYGSMRRNLDSAVAGSAMNLSFYANGGASGTTSTLELKTLTVLTY